MILAAFMWLMVLQRYERSFKSYISNASRLSDQLSVIDGRYAANTT